MAVTRTPAEIAQEEKEKIDKQISANRLAMDYLKLGGLPAIVSPIMLISGVKEAAQNLKNGIASLTYLPQSSQELANSQQNIDDYQADFDRRDKRAKANPGNPKYVNEANTAHNKLTQARDDYALLSKQDTIKQEERKLSLAAGIVSISFFASRISSMVARRKYPGYSCHLQVGSSALLSALLTFTYNNAECSTEGAKKLGCGLVLGAIMGLLNFGFEYLEEFFLNQKEAVEEKDGKPTGNLVISQKM